MELDNAGKNSLTEPIANFVEVVDHVKDVGSELLRIRIEVHGGRGEVPASRHLALIIALLVITTCTLESLLGPGDFTIEDVVLTAIVLEKSTTGNLRCLNSGLHTSNISVCLSEVRRNVQVGDLKSRLGTSIPSANVVNKKGLLVLVCALSIGSTEDDIRIHEDRVHKALHLLGKELGEMLLQLPPGLSNN